MKCDKSSDQINTICVWMKRERDEAFERKIWSIFTKLYRWLSFIQGYKGDPLVFRIEHVTSEDILSFQSQALPNSRRNHSITATKIEVLVNGLSDDTSGFGRPDSEWMASWSIIAAVGEDKFDILQTAIDSRRILPLL